MRNSVTGVRSEVLVQAGTVHGGVHIHDDGAGRVEPQQLPVATATFTDREGETARIERLIAAEDTPERPTIIVITGMHGSGKTELALQCLASAAERFPDGRYYADLSGQAPATAADPGAVLDVFLHGSGNGTSVTTADTQAKTALFRSLTADRAVAILLDDALNVGQVTSLLPTSARALVIVTSTSPLPGLASMGAEPLRLDPMDTEAILELFRRHLAHIAPRRLDSESRAAVRLAEHCHGLPLLARLAAVRLAEDPYEPIADIVAEIEAHGSLRVLSDGHGESVSLSAMLDASYRRLSPSAARVYRALGAHPVPEFDQWAVAAVLGVDVAAARGHLRELSRGALVEPAPHGRYWMHSLVHEHAQTVAVQEGEGAESAQAVAGFARYYLTAAVAADRRLNSRWTVGPHYDTPPQVAIPEFATPEERSAASEPQPSGLTPLAWTGDNLRAIMALAERHNDPTRGPCGEPGYVWQLAEATDSFFRARGHSADRFRLAELGAHDARACGDVFAEARVRNQWGFALLDHERFTAAYEQFSSALELSERAEDRRGQGAALECLGIVSWRMGQFAAALDYIDRSQPFLAELGRPRSLALHHLHRGRALAGLERYEEALSAFDRAWQGLRSLAGSGQPDRVNEGKVLLARGDALAALGRGREAVTAGKEALARFVAAESRFQQGQAYEVLARAEAARDGSAAGRDRLRTALAIYGELRNEAAAARVRSLLGEGEE
ncbi:NB-ARC domain-containing protein [Salinactinospora qingdaonensis]